MIREGGLSPANVFDRVRLRVNELTKGAQVPWDASKIETQFMFLERGPGAPPRADSPEHTAWMRSQPMRSLGAHDAYMVALMRDTFDAYADFLADYWRDPMTKRVRALLAARREAITWRRTYQANVPDAYWSYLERYPRGSHVADARRLLTRLGAAIAPPSKFARMDYDVPPPLPDELEYIERTVLAFDDPAFAFEPPQPSPDYFLQPPPPELLTLAPPATPSGAHILPEPVFVPLPVYVDVPAYVVAPPNSSIFNNAHKTPVINNTDNVPTRPDGQAVSSSISAAYANGLADGPRLPSSGATKATLINGRTNPVAREAIKVPPSPACRGTLDAPLGNPGSGGAGRHQGAAEPTFGGIFDAFLGDREFDTGKSGHRTVHACNRSSAANSGPHNARAAASGHAATSSALRNAVPAGDRQHSAAEFPVGNAAASRRAAGIFQRPVLSPQTTDSTPQPAAPPPTRNRPKPVTHAASTSSPTAVDQAEHPPASLLDRLVRAPDVAPGASPVKPQKKPCPVVNGKRICS